MKQLFLLFNYRNFLSMITFTRIFLTRKIVNSLITSLKTIFVHRLFFEKSKILSETNVHELDLIRSNYFFNFPIEQSASLIYDLHFLFLIKTHAFRRL